MLYHAALPVLRLKQREYYLRVRQQVSRSRHRRAGPASRPWAVNVEASVHVAQLWKRLLITDFEAAIELEVWDALPQIVDEGKEVNDKELFRRLADMLLASKAPRPSKRSMHGYPRWCLQRRLTVPQPWSPFLK